MTLPTLDNEDSNKKKKSNALPDISMPPIEVEDENEMPSIGSEGNFEDVDVHEALYNEDDDKINQEINEDIEEGQAPIERNLPEVQDDDEKFAGEDDYYPEYEEDLQEEQSDKFINKKKRRIIPFGGKKSKRKMFVKSSDMDDRKNKLAKTKIIQLLIILGVLLLFFIGLKNTFAPSHVYTSDQIRQFAKEGAGQTGFPEERGKSYVENFMNSYLTLDKKDPETLATLSYYYGRENFSNDSLSGLNINWNTDTKQNVLISPKVFDTNLLTEYSAQYKVSAYVTDSKGESFENKSRVGKWLSFSVNLYYDEATDSLAITPESPILIPNENVSETSNVPHEKGLGNGQVNKEILQAMTPTIDGFVEAYAKSSIDSHNSALQYIEDRNDISLYDGFNGAVELNGSPESSIKKVVYNTEKEGTYEVDITVDWADTQASSEGNTVEYTSRYKMVVKSNEEDKFAVTSFSPYLYYTD